MLRRLPWWQSVKPVVVTPEGLAMTPVEAGLLPALNPGLSLQSLADFSRRLLPLAECAPASGSSSGGLPPPSAEGNEQRCFQHLLVCGRTTRGKEPTELYQFGQAVAQQTQHHHQQLAADAPVQVGSGDSSSDSSGSSGRLRVVFVQRGSVGRQLLNVAELVQRCNSWHYRLPNTSAGSAGISADCRQVRWGSAPVGMDAA